VKGKSFSNPKRGKKDFQPLGGNRERRKKRGKFRRRNGLARWEKQRLVRVKTETEPFYEKVAEKDFFCIEKKKDIIDKKGSLGRKEKPYPSQY